MTSKAVDELKAMLPGDEDEMRFFCEYYKLFFEDLKEHIFPEGVPFMPAAFQEVYHARIKYYIEYDGPVTPKFFFQAKSFYSGLLELATSIPEVTQFIALASNMRDEDWGDIDGVLLCFRYELAKLGGYALHRVPELSAPLDEEKYTAFGLLHPSSAPRVVLPPADATSSSGPNTSAVAPPAAPTATDTTTRAADAATATSIAADASATATDTVPPSGPTMSAATPPDAPLATDTTATPPDTTTVVSISANDTAEMKDRLPAALIANAVGELEKMFPSGTWYSFCENYKCRFATLLNKYPPDVSFMPAAFQTAYHARMKYYIEYDGPFTSKFFFQASVFWDKLRQLISNIPEVTQFIALASNMRDDDWGDIEGVLTCFRYELAKLGGYTIRRMPDWSTPLDEEKYTACGLLHPSSAPRVGLRPVGNPTSTVAPPAATIATDTAATATNTTPAASISSDDTTQLTDALPAESMSVETTANNQTT